MKIRSNKIITRNIIILFFIIILINSCKKEEQTVTPPPPENEFITTVLLKCINQNNPADTFTGKWSDLTPEDLNAPDTSNAILNLKVNAIYDCEIVLLDETGIETEIVSEEVRDRQNYHIFCFNVRGGNLSSNFSMVATDFDTNNPPLPVGLNDRITTINSDSGIVNIVLKHQPNGKDGMCDAGTADLDINFRINITN